MDDPNITMEEYIRIEEEKARKHRKVFNWETAKYGRIWYDEDIHDLRSIENEFPAITFNDSLKSGETLSCEPTVFDFAGLPDLMAKGFSARMLMEHRDAQGIRITSAGDFLGTTPSYTLIRDLILRLCHRLIVRSIVGRSRLFADGRKSGALISGGQFVARLAEHFGLLMKERLQGLAVIAPALSVIDMAELVRLQICMEINDTWAWVAILEEDVYEIRGALAEQREVIGAMARDFLRFTIWAASGIAQLLDFSRVTYTPYFETRIPYHRRVRRKTDGASTSMT
ncbi:hypothetical protein Tco_1377741 [Tanacetum coccineum]